MFVRPSTFYTHVRGLRQRSSLKCFSADIRRAFPICLGLRFRCPKSLEADILVRQQRRTMMKLYIPTMGRLLIAEQQDGKWQIASHLVGMQVMSLAIDPFHPERVYCGTYGRGLWRSDDAGRSWEPIGDVPFNTGEGGISFGTITAIAVSSAERVEEHGVVYVGTEPSALFRTEDGGETWQELNTFGELPSASTWSFPPKPATSLVRWITPDLAVAGRVFVAVEAGALVLSLDGGAHWEDRVPDGPIDTHTLVMHPDAPDRLYSAAGDGFFTPGTGYQQSYDAGLP